MLHRRRFLQASLLGAAALPALSSVLAAGETPATKPFSLKFAPHPDMFKNSVGKAVLDQIRFAHDQGFTAWEDNGMRKRSPEEQEAIGKLLSSLGMTMGVFVATADFDNPVFAGNKLNRGARDRDPAAVRAFLKREMEDTVATAKRCGARWVTVVPGTFDPNLQPEYQTASVVEHLKECAAVLEPAGVVMVLEPLNYMDHPGLYLQRSAHAFQLCRMVGSPSCKILFDIYHQQITEGNLINNMSAAWDEIAYLQIGDVPGRKEPTTGEINYRRVFAWIKERGFSGVLGMEHGNHGPGREGEQALISAYRSVDPA
ncbi:MAG: TIM barrel protein [Opitutaceae bacterium]|nr:TIM barrel protein [Opitutaceae bacterium]